MSTSSSQETATAIPEAKAPDDVTCQEKVSYRISYSDQLTRINPFQGEGTSDSGHYKTVCFFQFKGG